MNRSRGRLRNVRRAKRVSAPCALPFPPSPCFVLLFALSIACTEPAQHTASSSTIVWDPDGRSLWLTSPDDGAVVEIDPDFLEVISTIPIEGEPSQLAFVGDALYVTLARSFELAIVEGTGVRRIPTPCGGTRAIVTVDETAIVSCPNDDLVIGIVDEEIAWTIESPGRPTALAIRDDRLAVSASRSGVIRVYEDRSLVDEITLETRPGFAATQLDAIAADPIGSFSALYQRVDHDSDRDRPADRGGYGSVLDGEPRVEPRLRSRCGERYAVYDGGARVFSGASALAHSSDGALLWVAHRSTDDVAVLRCDGATPIGRAITFEVGRGPRGIVLSPDGRTAWVDAGFAHSVARLELDDEDTSDGPVIEATFERTRDVGPTLLSDDALRGRSIFFDADDTHLTPSGIVTCGTCHPDGGDDGLVWFLHTTDIAPKLRRTPPAWNARPELAPFHWNGELTDASSLAHTTIRALMEGDALLVDLDAISAWMAEAPAPPGRPHDAAQIARGRALFEESGCASCHAGELTSDARTHDVISASDDPLAQLDAVDTPSLRGVRARAPFFHDGRADTLIDVLTIHNERDRHGRTSQLAGDELAALVTYLESL
jgi:sugar lactone lactonase YvrE